MYIHKMVLMHEKGGVNVYSGRNQGDIRESSVGAFYTLIAKDLVRDHAPTAIIAGEVSQISTIYCINRMVYKGLPTGESAILRTPVGVDLLKE